MTLTRAELQLDNVFEALTWTTWTTRNQGMGQN